MLTHNANTKLLSRQYSIRTKNFHGRYGCMVTFEEGEILNSVRYKMDIMFHRDPSGNLILTLNRSEDVFINDIVPENFMDEIAHKTSQVMYPLTFKLDKVSGRFEIINIEAIQSRWETAKEKISNYFKGEIADRYIILTERAISSKENLFRKIQNDWFIQLYLKSFSKEVFSGEQVNFPTAGLALPVQYEIVQKLTERPEAKDIMVKIKGTINDERCAQDLAEGNDFANYRHSDPNAKDLKGICDLTYALNEDSRVLEGIDATFYTEYATPKKITVKMFLLETFKVDEIIKEQIL